MALLVGKANFALDDEIVLDDGISLTRFKREFK